MAKKKKRYTKKSKKDISPRQKIKSKARRSLTKREVSKKRKTYVIDTSAIINRIIPKLTKKGLKGKIIVPNVVMAEMENLANYGKKEGFDGLEQVVNLHKRKNLSVEFKGERPTHSQKSYAKSGEIDAMIRDLAYKNKATLITTDLVQAKSAQAYGINTLFFKVRTRKPTRKKRKKGIFNKFLKK